jgi:hypothetical protein
VLRLSAILSLSFIAIALGLAPRADAKADPGPAPAAPETIKVGIMSGMFKGVPAPLIKAGGNQFGGLFKQITGLPGAVQVEDKHHDLAKKLNDRDVHLGVFHGFEWAWLKKQNPSLAALAITIPTHLPQACIVVNVKENVAGPQGLKGANVDIPFNMKAHGFLYIEKLSSECPAGSFKPNLPDDLGPEEALDEVCRGKSVAALVDRSMLAGYQANNPGKAARVKVLCESDPLPQVVLVYNTTALPKKIVDQLRTGLLNANKNPGGRSFLFLWNLRGFEEPTPAFDDLLAKCLKAFPAPDKK